jgi:thiamine biosynthesis protein ThiS
VIQVNGKPYSWRAGMTVADLLNTLDDQHDYAVVRINDQYVSKPKFDAVLIPDDADVFLIPLVAGG